MKKIFAVVLAAWMLLSVVALAGVYAEPNQKLALRTGPNTEFVWLYMMPQDTTITAIEYEEGNGVTWVLVEFYKDGQRVRGYTGLKRMAVYGNIPWASHENVQTVVNTAGQVYAAPGADGAYRGKVIVGEMVTLLRYDGDYAYIEFYDGANKAVSRGWIPWWMIDSDFYDTVYPSFDEDMTVCAEANANQELALRTGPNRDYNWLALMPEDTGLTAYEYEEGNGVTWVLVEYVKDGLRYRGYTGLKRMTVYGDIPWADHLYLTRNALFSGPVSAAPGENAGYRGNVFYGQEVTLLRFDGDYAYIEFYDHDDDAISRGWVHESTIG